MGGWYPVRAMMNEIAEHAGATLLATALVVGAGTTLGAEPIEAITAATGLDIEKQRLGKDLFEDLRLSRDNTVSCATCHLLDEGGDDNVQVSTGIEERTGAVNAPTVFNVGLNIAQFWDGRAETLEEQVDGPIQNQDEMGSLWPDVIAKLEADPEYPSRFRAIWADRRIGRDTVREAIAEFMQGLRTPDSPFDRWLGGDTDALDETEMRGYGLFKSYGCASCHQGRNVGGNMFQVFGVLNQYFSQRGNITKADLGRFNVTGNEEDRHAFKVPSLRFARHTAPYLHDGTAPTLRDAVDAMFEFQLGRTAPDADKDAIVAFIKTLAGTPTGVNP